MPKEYLNYIQLLPQSVGNARRIEMLNDMLKDGTFLPRTVEYKDIDEAFREWVKSLTIISDEGKEFPTMTLFSNQRFSEYSQSWQYVDENKNLLLNFKTITRENNPQAGQIQGGFWNVPGDRYYPMKKRKVLDDNGSESYLTLKMRQPAAIDMKYKISIFTTKYASINEFNTIINKLFAARQCYIAPNGHFMPMILENISDESSYQIDDRQFYSQTFQIKLMAYVITENDFRVEETPLKVGGNFGFPKVSKRKAVVEIEEMSYIPLSIETECGVKKVILPQGTGNKKSVIDIEDLECNPEELSKYYYKPMALDISFPSCITEAKFTIDTDFVVTKQTVDEFVGKFSIFVNGEEASTAITEDTPLVLYQWDDIKVKINKQFHENENLHIIWNGYCPLIVYNEDLDDMEFDEDEEQDADIYEE